MNRRSRRDERGAIAVMVGLMGVMLLSMSALTLDLGQAYVARHDVQTSADFAALSTGNTGDLPTPATTGTCSGGSGVLQGPRASAGDQAVKDAVKYLKGQPGNFSTATATGLTDCSMANGEVVYGRVKRNAGGTWVETYNAMQLTVFTPPHQVDFGLAGILGINNVKVQRQATVGGGTPGGSRVFPAYSVVGCDWGPQTITDPANGHSTTTVPTLSIPADTNEITLDAATTPNPTPTQVALNPPTTTITVTGKNNMQDVTKIGFFPESGGAPVILQGSTLTHTQAKLLTFTVPVPGVTDQDGTVWWIRVWAPKTKNSPTFTWSKASEAIPFEVGTVYLRCGNSSTSGNFGELTLPRTDSTNNTATGWTARNIIKGLQSPLTLHTYPGSPTTYGGASTAPTNCVTTDSRTIYSTTTGSPVLKDQTNCVDTNTGLPANAMSSGLVQGVAGVTNPQGMSGGGLLVVPSMSWTSPHAGCPGPRSVTLTGPVQTYAINNDTLTCYLTNTTTKLQDIDSASYNGAPVFSCDIYDSPRFFYQPVLQGQPTKGGSLKWSIIDFRPAFLTDQVQSATKVTGANSTSNGVVVTSGKIDEIDVVFFSNKALDPSCSNAVSSGPLGGTTNFSIRLVD